MKLYKKSLSIFITVCLTGALILPLFLYASEDIDGLKEELEQQIEQKQTEIQKYQQNIQESQSKAQSLENEIAILEGEIGKMQAEIEQLNLNIRKKNLNIRGIDEKIDELELQIKESKRSLGEHLQKVAYYDKETLLEIVLKNNKFSDFFNDYKALENVQAKIHAALENIRGAKKKTESQKKEMEEELKEQNKLKSFQLIQKGRVESKQWQKENLLSRARNQAQQYQQLIQGAKQEINHIKEQLSLLDKYNITIDQAVRDAIFAASKTGIRPAFLLGVLEAESRLGLNVGTGNWREDMYQCYRSLGYITKAEREKNAFHQICEELNLDPNNRSVSAEPYYGCGGAMGIAQFMPTTWMAYKDDVANLTGHNPPNPWLPKDAFTAAAIKLSRGGANQRTETGERMAYAKYLAGGRYKQWMYHQVTNYVIDLTSNFQNEYFD